MAKDDLVSSRPAGGACPAEGAAQLERVAAGTDRAGEWEEPASPFAEKIARVGSAVAREIAPAEILEAVLDQTIRTLGASSAAVYLADEAERVLTLRGFRNLPDELRDSLARLSFDSPTLSARAASTRRIQVLSSLEEADSANLSFARDLMSLTGCETVCAVPLMARARLVGVLTFALLARHEFTPAESAALENCAEIFSFGIAHAALYDEERRLRTLFEAVGHASVAMTTDAPIAPFLQTIVNEARQMADAEFAALGIPGAEDKPVERWVFSGMTTEQVNRIGRMRCFPNLAPDSHIFRIGNLPPTTSLLQVPIHHDGACKGVLYLVNKRGRSEFSHEDERAVELLAAHIGAAIQQSHARGELDAERRRLKCIVENAPHGVVFVERREGNITANARAIELLGTPVPGDVSELWGRFLSPGGSALPEESWPSGVLTEGQPLRSQELRIRRPDARETPVLVSASRLRDSEGVEGLVVLFEDITVLKDLERLREDWAAIVTHDLRQPLTVMMTSLGVLERLAEDPDRRKLHAMAERMQRAATSLNRMISDLTDVSRIEASQLSVERHVVDFDSLVREVVGRQRSVSSKREIVLQLSGLSPRILGDPVRLEQVLVNLLTNAIKYSDVGTAIDVATDVTERELHVQVTNRGPGILTAELPRLFERYYRSPGARANTTPGLGLGLYIARGLVAAHGGHMWVESKPGETTTFHFTLPIVTQ